MAAKEKLKEAKRLYEIANADQRYVLESLFPELKESDESKDERIRKNCIHFLELQKQHHAATFEIEECIDWLEKKNSNVDNANKEYWRGYREGKQEILDKYVELEKQGEQKPIDKIQFGKRYKCIASPRRSAFMTGGIYKPEDKYLYSLMNLSSDCFEPIEDGEWKPADKDEPKFHEGDWLQYRNAKPFFVEGITKQGYVNGDSCLPFNWENEIHLWTINDAKDGDVLACNEEILLFKSYSVQNRISLYCWYNGQTNNFHSKEVNDTSLTTMNKICPATKEQRDLLFAKMKEAGYEWDANKKELKKIEQKPAWSEEDEQYKRNIESILNKDKTIPTDMYFRLCDWLKSLRPQTRWKPSEEQMEFLKKCIEAYNEVTFPTEVRVLSSLYNDLKKLKG